MTCAISLHPIQPSLPCGVTDRLSAGAIATMVPWMSLDHVFLRFQGDT